MSVFTPSRGRARVAVVAAVAMSVAAAQQSNAASLPDTTVPQSASVQLKANNHSAADLDRVKDAGLKYVRRGFIWQSVEKQKGVYDFSEYDRLLKDCRERGISILGCIALGNPIHSHVREDEGRQAYTAYAAALAEHFKGQPIIWEIWNEPNVQTFWGKHGPHNSEQFADEYVALVKSAVPAMKKADPNCTVVAGSVSGIWTDSYKWMAYCFEKGVLSSGIDAWSVHPYSTKNPEDYIFGYDKVRGMMGQYAGRRDVPLLNTERGFPLGKAEGFAGGDEAMSREYQAWHVVRQYMIDLLCDVRLTNWYEWSGDEGFSLVNGQEKLPAYYALRVMLEELDGYKLQKRIFTGSERDFVVRFTKGDASKLVVWTSPPPEGSADLAKPHEVQIPVQSKGDVTVIDIYGEEKTLPVANGKVAVTLAGAPQYLVEIADPNAPKHAPREKPPKLPVAAAATAPAAPAADLKLFDMDKTWTFEKNTGDGAFELAKDGEKPIGRLTFDFTQSAATPTPYVVASTDVEIGEGAKAVQLSARASQPQRVTIRVVDSTGQTHQIKGQLKSTGEWERITLPLDKKLEHWGGANDGKVHFPVKQIVTSIPLTGETRTGKVEFTDAGAVGK